MNGVKQVEKFCENIHFNYIDLSFLLLSHQFRGNSYTKKCETIIKYFEWILN